MKKIDENTKITLTLAQLRKLVRESDGSFFDVPPREEDWDIDPKFMDLALIFMGMSDDNCVRDQYDDKNWHEGDWSVRNEVPTPNYEIRYKYHLVGTVNYAEKEYDVFDNSVVPGNKLGDFLRAINAEGFKRKNEKIDENMKVTLTFGQLKRLVMESESENEFREFFGVKSSRIRPVGDESFGGTEGRPKTYQNIEIDGVEAGYVERREASVGGVFAHYLKPDKYADHNVLFVLIVNPLDENGNEIDFAKEVGHDKDLSFPNEEWWEVRFKSEDEMLSAFDTLQRKFKGAVFDFSDEAIERIADWERENGISS